jgi:hypothetical protein
LDLDLALRAVVCAWAGCGRQFLLCSACDRGRRYCGDRCREMGRSASLKRARRKYASSARGLEKGRWRQKRWRCRLVRTVTDQSSQEEAVEAECARPEGLCPHGVVKAGAGGGGGSRCACCGRRGRVRRQGAEKGRFRGGGGCWRPGFKRRF